MPSSNSHLVLRSSTWHCRIDVPADLRPAYGNRRILSISLRTGDKLLARELAAVQVGQWKAAFRALRDAKLRSGDKWKETLATKAKDLHETADDAILSLVRGRLPTGAAPLAAGEDPRAAIRQSLERVERLAKKVGYPYLRRDIRSLIDQNPDPASLLNGLYTIGQDMLAYAAKAKHLLSDTELTEALSIARTPESYKPKSPISVRAQDKFAAYYAEQSQNERTRRVYLSNIRRFSTWLTTHGKELTFDSVAEYLDSVSKARQTRIGHLAALRAFHKWATRYEPYYRELMSEKRSPFDGHSHPKVGENAGESWIPYTRQEAEQLHAAAIKKGDVDLADLIAFGCYTGCRIEELGRIRKETTIFDDSGRPIGFRVDDAKTPAGVRDIPLHPALIPIYERRLLSPQGASFALFPGNDRTKNGLRMNALSQRFTKLKRAEGFGDRHVFHSFRKTTTTMLQQSNASPLTIPFILGHEVGNITFDVYSAGPSFQQKLDAIQKLQFSFNIKQ